MTDNFQQISRITLLCLFFIALSAECVSAYTILSPASSQAILIQARQAHFTLIIKVTKQEELAGLQVLAPKKGGKEDQTIVATKIFEKNGASYLHYVLPLDKGANTFTINPGENRLEIRYLPIRTLLNINFEDPKAFLFHRTAVIPQECDLCHSEELPKDAGLDVSRLRKNADYSPVCFSCHRNLHTNNEWLHGPTANVLCMSCHRQGTGNTKITRLSGRVDEVCFQCHINKKKFKELKHVHGPVGPGDCTICHDPHGDAYKFQLWADGKTDLCTGCHGDKKNAKKKTAGFYPHGIIFGGGCVVCHSPHASNNPFQLQKPINELCVSCHSGLADMAVGHPVGRHPLKGKADPRRKGRELSCTSCHNPHGSNYRFLLIGDILGGHVCSKCHEN